MPFGTHELTSYCYLLLVQCLAAFAWQQETVLDDAGLIHLYWTVDVKKNVLLFEIQAQTGGYVGLGISPDGTMRRADIMVGYVDGNGESNVTDYWASENGRLQTETSQDWKILTGRQNNSHTMLRVRRPLTTDDSLDAKIFNVPTWIIWALHPDDPSPGQMPLYHEDRRGARELCIIKPDCEAYAAKRDHRFNGSSSYTLHWPLGLTYALSLCLLTLSRILSANV